jgi:hypothetical protein
MNRTHATDAKTFNYADLFERLDSILIEHRHFHYALGKLDRAISSSKRYADADIKLLLGESRTGKSRLLEILLHKHPPYRTSEKRVCPVLRIKISRKPTVKGLLQQLLHELGDVVPPTVRLSEIALTLKLITLLKECEVKALLLDEFQHFLSSRGDLNYEVADLFKSIADEANVSIIFCGLPVGAGIVDGNEQLRGRASRPLKLPRFDWNKKESRDEFMFIINNCVDAIKPISSPDFNNEDWGFRWYCATGGLIGYALKIFRTALDNAAIRKVSRLDARDYGVAHREAVFSASEIVVGPFDPGFIRSAETQAAALDVGKEVIPGRPSRKNFGG